jgi:hypothetical protein
MDAHNRAIALGLLVIFVDNQLDPRGLASPARVNARPCKCDENIDLRIHIVGAMYCTRLNHRSRVQVIGANTIDDEPSLLRQLVQLGRVELDTKDVYSMNKVRSYPRKKNT